MPPVANDSGSAIGTAIDAQLHFTGNPKINWNVYSGLGFIAADSFDLTLYDLYETNYELIADMLANELIIGWVSGKYEIGPRALGNRSILAAPFQESTRVRLNEIKQRDQFRPIAPVCLEEEAARWFGCDEASPFMLFTHRVKTKALAAVHPRERDCSHSDSVTCDQSKFVRTAYRIQETYRIRRLVVILL